MYIYIYWNKMHGTYNVKFLFYITFHIAFKLYWIKKTANFSVKSFLTNFKRVTWLSVVTALYLLHIISVFSSSLHRTLFRFLLHLLSLTLSRMASVHVVALPEYLGLFSCAEKNALSTIALFRLFSVSLYIWSREVTWLDEREETNKVVSIRLPVLTC